MHLKIPDTRQHRNPSYWYWMGEKYHLDRQTMPTHSWKCGWWQRSTVDDVWVPFPSEPVGMKGEKPLEVTHAAALFQPLMTVENPHGSVFNSCFRTAGCTCSALTTTTSSTLLWREVLQGGWLWGSPVPSSALPIPSPGLCVGDVHFCFCAFWIRVLWAQHCSLSLWKALVFFISLTHPSLCFMAAGEKVNFFFRHFILLAFCR